MKKLLASLFLMVGTAQAAESLQIDVHRDPNCGCCKAWIEHLRDNGFAVNDQVTADLVAFKQTLGVPRDLVSCHTAVFNGHFVEGHVPAADVKRLTEQPDIAGIAAPGMPIGSPGMEMGGGRQDPYQVIAVDQQGQRRVFSSYP